MLKTPIGLIEGASYLVLLGVAMPLKYIIASLLPFGTFVIDGRLKGEDEALRGPEKSPSGAERLLMGRKTGSADVRYFQGEP